MQNLHLQLIKIKTNQKIQQKKKKSKTRTYENKKSFFGQWLEWSIQLEREAKIEFCIHCDGLSRISLNDRTITLNKILDN